MTSISSYYANSTAPSRLTFAGLSLAIALSLSACGGGGGGSSSTPANAGGPKAVPVYNAALTSQTIPSLSSVNIQTTLTIVDTANGSVAREIDGISWDQTSPQQHSFYPYVITKRYVANTGGGITMVGAGQLYYVQNGKVMQLDISGPTLGEAKQISSESAVCGLADSKTLPLSIQGDVAWLRAVVLKPAQSDCNASGSTKEVLVKTDMASNKAGLLAGVNGIEPIAALISPDGQTSNGVLAFNGAGHNLAAYDNDLITPKIVNVPDQGTLAASTAASLVSLHPALPDRALIRVGSKLYIASWTGANVTLTSAVASLNLAATDTTALKSTLDTNVWYVADGLTLFSVAPTTGQKTDLGALSSADGGVITGMWTTPNAIVVQQKTGDTVSTVTSINKSSHDQLTLLTNSTAASGIVFGGLSGDNAFLLERSDSQSQRYTLWKVDVLTPANDGSKFAAKQKATNDLGVDLGVITPVEMVMANPQQLGTDQISKLTWCTVANGDFGCGNTNLQSYELATGKVITIGTLTAPVATTTDINGNVIPATQQSFFFYPEPPVPSLPTRLSPMYHAVGNPPSFDTTLWLWNADTANSLVAVKH